MPLAERRIEQRGRDPERDQHADVAGSRRAAIRRMNDADGGDAQRTRRRPARAASARASGRGRRARTGNPDRGSRTPAAPTRDGRAARPATTRRPDAADSGAAPTPRRSTSAAAHSARRAPGWPSRDRGQRHDQRDERVGQQPHRRRRGQRSAGPGRVGVQHAAAMALTAYAARPRSARPAADPRCRARRAAPSARRPPAGSRGRQKPTAIRNGNGPAMPIFGSSYAGSAQRFQTSPSTAVAAAAGRTRGCPGRAPRAHDHRQQHRVEHDAGAQADQIQQLAHCRSLTRPPYARSTLGRNLNRMSRLFRPVNGRSRRRAAFIVGLDVSARREPARLPHRSRHSSASRRTFDGRKRTVHCCFGRLGREHLASVRSGT